MSADDPADIFLTVDIGLSQLNILNPRIRSCYSKQPLVGTFPISNKDSANGKIRAVKSTGIVVKSSPDRNPFPDFDS